MIVIDRQSFTDFRGAVESGDRMNNGALASDTLCRITVFDGEDFTFVLAVIDFRGIDAAAGTQLLLSIGLKHIPRLPFAKAGVVMFRGLAARILNDGNDG